MTDQAARERAARCYDKNLVVVAGAGTGKTSLLVERLLNQLVEQDLAIEQVAAITFTEKAATEMRSRLELGLARLVELTRDPDPRLEEREEADRAFRWLRMRIGPAELRARAERLLARVGHATVSTIHAFCSSLLRRFPVEAGIDPDFSVDDGLLYETLRNEVWEDFLSGPDGPEGERAELWRDVLVRLDLWELGHSGLSVQVVSKQYCSGRGPVPWRLLADRL